MAQVTIESGLWTTVWRKKKASTTFAKKQLVDLSSGYIQPSTSSTKQVFGVNQDNEYANTDTTTVEIPVLVPRGYDSYVRATATGTLAATDEGSEFDLLDSQTVNKAASTHDPVKCIRYISTTEGIFALTVPRVT
jgi:hypothetical protein